MKDNSLVAANEIWCTTIDGKPISYIGSFQGALRSRYWKGVFEFERPVVEIRDRPFEKSWQSQGNICSKG